MKAIAMVSWNADAHFLKQKNDDELWKLVESSLKDLHRVSRRISQLTTKEKDKNLSDDENTELDSELELYDIHTLLRAKVLIELQKRGYNIQAYLESVAPK